MPPQLKNAEIVGAEDYIVRFPDGRVMRDMEVALERDTYLQLRQGYMCANCYEPLDAPFPEVCSLPGCGFKVKDDQVRFLEERFGGERWIGPSKALIERLQTPPETPRPKNSTIWVPGDAA